MEENPSLATGYNATSDSRITSRALWEDIANQLNSHGPPIRNRDSWKKVWSDFKFHIKKKLKLNKLSISGTGGGPSKLQTFSAIEEAVIKLVNLNSAVDGIEEARAMGDNNLDLPNITEYNTINDNQNEANSEHSDNNINLETQPARTTNLRRTKEITERQSEKLIQKQIDLQQTFHQNINQKLESLTNMVAEGNSSLRRLVRLKEKSLEIKKREIVLKERELKLRESEFNLKEREKLEKRKLKVQELEIKKQKLELQQGQIYNQN